MQWEYLAFAALAFGIVVLLLLINWKSRLKMNQRSAQFQALCRSNGLQTDLFEFFYDRAIGIDYHQGAVLFMHFFNTQYKHKILLVENILECTVEKKYNENNIIDRIYLNCRMRDKQDEQLNFYSSKTDMHLDATQLIRKSSYWKRKINLLKQYEDLSMQQYR